MLILSLFIIIVSMPLSSQKISAVLFNRIICISLMLSALLSINSLFINQLSLGGLGIYSGLFHVTTLSLSIDFLLCVTSALILSSWANYDLTKNINYEFFHKKVPIIKEFSLIALFSVIGSLFLISSTDFLSMFLSLELQSFAVYLLATLYRDSESSTSAGLKYFLLGGFSSCLILLGLSFIYKETGLTQLENLSHLLCTTYSSNSLLSNESHFTNLFSLELFGFILMLTGFLFKIAASPFHFWAPDVYDGTPTQVTTWLTIMPKISILIFILLLQSYFFPYFSIVGTTEMDLTQFNLKNIMVSMNSVSSLVPFNFNIFQTILLVSSIFSLIIGTIAGLAQTRLKRLLAFSTISHVGFLLLALSINTQGSQSAFLFYLISYTLTNLNAFLIILALATTSEFFFNKVKFLDKNKTLVASDIILISELKGVFKQSPALCFSLSLSLFSMAGIPPLIGFFAKQQVLTCSIQSGYWTISIIAILVSVISAAYYLKIVRTIFFQQTLPTGKGELLIPSKEGNQTQENKNSFNNMDLMFSDSNKISYTFTSTHSFIISVLTFILVGFVLSPTLLLNSCKVLALMQFSI